MNYLEIFLLCFSGMKNLLPAMNIYFFFKLLTDKVGGWESPLSVWNWWSGPYQSCQECNNNDPKWKKILGPYEIYSAFYSVFTPYAFLNVGIWKCSLENFLLRIHLILWEYYHESLWYYSIKNNLFLLKFSSPIRFYDLYINW